MERTIVDLREEIALRALNGRYSVTEVAAMFGVSRPTVRMWRERYRALGRAGLADRSHAPHSIPHKTSTKVEALIVAERKKWRFGSKKILARLSEQHPAITLPKRATVDAILARHDLVQRRAKRRRNAKTPFIRRYVATKPGELMTADFKGQFRMGNGRYCYPLTLVDNVSRYVLACEALTCTRFEEAWSVIERVFRVYGLPTAMQSDNGPPFGPIDGRYSRMSVELMKLEIQPVFSRPGRPGDNGSHERTHRELKDRTTRPPSGSLRHQQRQFDAFRRMYNEERPHEGIKMMRPSRLYRRAKLRSFPRRRSAPQYDERFEVRRVSSNGMFRWHGRDIFLSQAFAGEQIGLEPINGQWSIHFYSFVIGKVDEKDGGVL